MSAETHVNKTVAGGSGYKRGGVTYGADFGQAQPANRSEAHAPEESAGFGSKQNFQGGGFGSVQNGSCDRGWAAAGAYGGGERRVDLQKSRSRNRSASRRDRSQGRRCRQRSRDRSHSSQSGSPTKRTPTLAGWWPTENPCTKALMLGDDGWFADREKLNALASLLDNRAQAQAAVMVASPHEEVCRMFPGCDEPLVPATVVLKVGGDPGARVAFGEEEIAGAYRKLSRAVHPDKTRGIENSDDAFKRLKEAADELRHDVKAAQELVREVEQLLCDQPVDESLLKRPHAMLFATILRYLMVLVGLIGEGSCEDAHRKRAALAIRQASGAEALRTSDITESWLAATRLLERMGTSTVRHSFECVPAQYQAQFVCVLSRVMLVEEAPGELVRPQWRDVLVLFPEMRTWRHLWDFIRSVAWKDKSKAAKRRNRSSSSGSTRSSRSWVRPW